MRRPLTLVCLISCFVVFLYAIIIGSGQNIAATSSSYSFLYGNSLQVIGKVDNKEIKNDNQVLYLRCVTFCDGEISFNNKNKGIICYVSLDENVPLGSFVMLSGEAKEFRQATNEGEFDLAKYYFSQGYIFQMKNCTVISKSVKYSYVKEKLYDLKMYLGEIADRIFFQTDSGIMKAMILGEKSDLDQDIKGLYQKSGISHILAISGLHISLIGMCLYKLLKRIGIPVTARTVIPIIVMILYGIMCGSSTSTIRAVFMFCLMMFSYIKRRTYDLPTALSLAALMISILNCFVYLSSSFYLSFMAVFGIAIFSKYIVPKSGNKAMRAILSSLSVSYFTLPILLFFYYEYPLYSIFLNLLIIPLMGILIAFGIVGILIGTISINVAIVVAYPCHYILWFYEKLCNFTGDLPKNHIIMGKPHIVCIAIFYIICIFYVLCSNYFSKEECKIKYKSFIKILILFLGVLVLIKIPPNLRISVIDVGQGDGICIEIKNKVLMVDGGSSSKSDVAKYQIVPLLKAKGISKIDYWLVSHPDEDHVSGLVEMLNDDTGIVIRNIILPHTISVKEDTRELITLANNNKINISYVGRGDGLKIGGAEFICINPDTSRAYEDVNEYSEVFLFKYKDFKMLFTGDSTKESEETYLNYCHDQKIDIQNIDVLKVAHHGSNTSSSEKLIMYINPKISIISCGKNNRYGHPKKEILERLTGSKIYRTDEGGEIVIDIDKKASEIIIKEFVLDSDRRYILQSQ